LDTRHRPKTNKTKTHHRKLDTGKKKSMQNERTFNHMTLNVPDEGYSRNAWRALY